MKRTIVVLATCFLILSASAIADDQDEKSTTEVVNLLSNCSGYYGFLAAIAEKDGMREVAEQFRGSARGAKFSAAYLLSIEASAKGRARKLGEFGSYIDSIAALAKSRMMASMEVGDDAPIKEQGDLCIAAMELQKALVQEMRNEMIDR